MIENTSFQVKEGGVRLDAALLLAFPTSTRAFVREAIAKGDVRVDGRPAPKGLKLRGTETVQVVALAEAADNTVAPNRDIPLSDASSIGSAMTLRCMTLTGESVFLILFDEKMHQVAFSRVSDGVVNSAEVSTRRVAESAYFSHARYAVLVHNHPFGTTAASQNDIFSTYLFSETLDMVNCTLLEHLIVSGNRFSPLLLLLKENEAPGFDVKGFYSALFLRDFPNIKK